MKIRINGKKRRYPRHKKVLFTGGIALIGLTAMLGQTDLPVKIAQVWDGGTTQSDLPEFPDGGFQDSGTTYSSSSSFDGGTTAGFDNGATAVEDEVLQAEDGAQEQDSSEAVDPSEVKSTLLNISDLKKELAQLTKDFKKVEGTGNEVRKLEELAAQVKQMEADIKANQKSGGDLGNALQEWNDAQIWDTINQSRQAIGLPKEIQQVGKDLKKLDSFIKGKNVLKKLPLDSVRLTKNITAVREALAESKSAYKSGNLDEADNALEPIHDGMQPDVIVGVLYRLRDFSTQLGAIKDAEAKKAISKVVNPVIKAANDGNFDDANVILNASFKDLAKLTQTARSIGKPRAITRAKLNKQIDSLGKRINDKLNSLNQKKASAGNQPG